MKWLQGTYTQRHNSRHKVRGHLFQGRYKAVVVDGSDDYLQVVSTYIHLNPARARLIRVGEERLKSYPWSSYPAYLRGKGFPWLDWQPVLGALGLKSGDSRSGVERVTEGSDRESSAGGLAAREYDGVIEMGERTADDGPLYTGVPSGESDEAPPRAKVRSPSPQTGQSTMKNSISNECKHYRTDPSYNLLF